MYTIRSWMSGACPEEYGLFKTEEGARRALRKKGYVTASKDNKDLFKIHLVFRGGDFIFFAEVVYHTGPRNTRSLPDKNYRVGFPGGTTTCGPIKVNP